MAEIVYGIDFRKKKRSEPVKASPQGLSLDMPPEILMTIYESSLGYVATKDEPA